MKLSNYTTLVYGDPVSYNIGLSRAVYVILFNLFAILIFYIGHLWNNITLQVFSAFGCLLITITMLKPGGESSSMRSHVRGKERRLLSWKLIILAVIVEYITMRFFDHGSLEFIVGVIILISLVMYPGLKTQWRTRKSNKDGKYPNIFNPKKILVFLICVTFWVSIFKYLY